MHVDDDNYCPEDFEYDEDNYDSPDICYFTTKIIKLAILNHV